MIAEQPLKLQLEEKGLNEAWQAYCQGRSVELKASGASRSITDWWSEAANDPGRIEALAPAKKTSLVTKFYDSLQNPNGQKAPASQAGSGSPSQNESLVRLEQAIKAFTEDLGEGASVHPSTHKVCRKLLAGRNVYLYGPAGSGKSFLAAQVAKILGIFFSLLGEEAPTKEVGFFDMVSGPNFSEFDYLAKAMPVASKTGQTGLCVIESPFMRAFQTPYSLAFIDEIDVCPPEANLSLNGALASRRQFNPACGETVACAEGFFFLAAGNTDLNGPTPEYPARMQQDSAFISRFAASRILVEYSEELEAKILLPEVRQFLKACRTKAANKGLPVELSTRLGVNMSEQIKSGLFSAQEVFADWAAELNHSVRTTLGLETLVKKG